MRPPFNRFAVPVPVPVEVSTAHPDHLSSTTVVVVVVFVVVAVVVVVFIISPLFLLLLSIFHLQHRVQSKHNSFSIFREYI